MDNDLIQFLVVAAIALLTGLYNWFRRRQGGLEDTGEEGEKPPPQQPGRQAGPQRPPPRNWEEELRRLLEGQESKPTPPPVPPVLPEPRREVPPPLPPVPRPQTTRPMAAPVIVARREALEREEEGEGRGLAVSLPVAQPGRAFELARQLETRVAAQMRGVGERVRQHAKAQPAAKLRPDLAQAKAMFAGPQSARAAIIATVVLGPPKAFDS